MATCGQKTPPLSLSELNAIHQWAESLLHQQNKQDPTIEGTIQNTDPWVLAVAMVEVIMGDKSDGCRNKEERMLRVIELVCCKMVPEWVSLLTVSREVADSRTAGIFIRDWACFHCDLMNYELLIESQ